jgi:chromatin remodeling complex protein RSC6
MPPRKTVKTEQTAAVEQTVQPVVQQVPAAVLEKKTSRKSKKEVPQATEQLPSTVTVTPALQQETVVTEKKRREVNKESIDRDFTHLETKVNEEIEKLNSSGKKVKGIKLLRGLLKLVRTLHNDANRVLKFKKDGAKKNVSSGFLKPIHISPEMAKFTAWEPTKLYTRVDVTKFVCKYIKENNLFNPSDQREIRCDDRLRNLLKYDVSTAAKDEAGNPVPLTYFRLQQYLKIHFVK